MHCFARLILDQMFAHMTFFDRFENKNPLLIRGGEIASGRLPDHGPKNPLSGILFIAVIDSILIPNYFANQNIEQITILILHFHFLFRSGFYRSLSIL